MKYRFFLASALATIATAMPTTPNIAARDPFTGYLPITLTFHGGPATYTLDMIADGNSYNTSRNPFSYSPPNTANHYADNGIDVSVIDTASFDIWFNCNFYTTGQKVIAATGSGTTVQVGPPQPVLAVACKPTPNPPGTCLPDFAMCEWCGGGFGGCMLSSCCTGFCAATRCRPFPPTQT